MIAYCARKFAMPRFLNVTQLSASLGLVCLLLAAPTGARGQIPQPTDAPRPLPPEESAQHMVLPPGFRLELVASEPLIREPSGVCWDEQGRLFVCELHGYNLEGQYDIEELNKTGQLDREVRRVQANEQAQRAAEAGTYGVVKRLIDSDHDGRMDRAEVWADRLPPCYGLCPARGGVIVACAPDIVFLADRDGDGHAEVRETLYTGFATGALERGINCPQWGLDDWIYAGGGHGGGTITGPHLKHPVQLPRTDFRLKADGSAIEPISGSTHTFGFTFTELGERFVITTRTPGIFVAPLPWRYLTRNPDAAAPRLEQNAAAYQEVFPISQPHPWRTRRAEDPGFAKFYTDRYGVEESAPSGYFTSACSPLVYQDDALPGLRGQLLACEPAQNLIHRAIIESDGSRLTLHRAPGEAESEFLASRDSWFHPIALSHGPDGGVWIVDYYREIIEDYSAIPRYLQQQYGLVNGQDHGRIWRLVHEQTPEPPSANMAGLSAEELTQELASRYFWRRQTARRLLVERREIAAAPQLAALARESAEPAAALGALYTLEALGRLSPEVLTAAMKHSEPGVRVHALRLADRRFNENAALLEAATTLHDDPAPAVRLQLALSLGESLDAKAVPLLAVLAQKHGDAPWMHEAILSSASGRAGALLDLLLQDVGQHARGLLGPLCAAVAARREPAEFSAVVMRVAAAQDDGVRLACLEGLRRGAEGGAPVALFEEAATALRSLSRGPRQATRAAAQSLVETLRLESPEERQQRLAQAAQELKDVRLPTDVRLAAVAQLAAERDPRIMPTLLSAFVEGTPAVREAILAAAFARRERHGAILDALEAGTILGSALSAVQRTALLEHSEPQQRQRAARLLSRSSGAPPELFQRFAAALQSPRDAKRGEQVFREKCATCHQAHGMGANVGPDLTAEFQRAEETIIRDILAPSDAITAGYATYAIETIDGRILTGLLADESANSLTLRQAEGKEQLVLRKDIELLRALPVSLMPDDLAKSLEPADVAHVIAWLRTPANRRVLADDNPAFAEALNDGAGTAEMVSTDAFRGARALRITPPQRYSPHIAGWAFRIRENPGPGEFRYLRFAWKSEGASGVMLELADHGHWPRAEQPQFRYYAGQNATGWQAVEVSAEAPTLWTVVTRDLWQDFGDSVLTGIAPTAMGGPALFDAVELLRSPEEAAAP
jgi:putative membrane-bound dehydrogenase-like protein